MKKHIIFLFASLLFLLSGHSAIAQQVSGKFLTTKGNIIKAHIVIKNQAPQSLIVEQRIPKGTKVLSTKPAAQKISSSSGMVKWLFKNLSAGDQILTMKVSPPLQKKPRGVLRYIDPATGKSVEKRF
ncbi:hypothetical protein [Desulfopila sp. IMCC35008]|uniref:hypothetical protein n=1 Tax=Desulfopila sp. IMCC35008 TaxID=2653858 RepID=UPI0013CFB52E|nr:hypothetical protein [Desulfopila sp. IMCC35008]